MRIPFAFTGSAERLAISRVYGIHRFYFCGRSLGETASTSLFLSFFFLFCTVCGSESVIIVIASLTSRTTVLRNAGNWQGKRGRNEKKT